VLLFKGMERFVDWKKVTKYRTKETAYQS
jgi:hypothetical protein